MPAVDAETDGRLRAASFAFLDKLAAKGQPSVRQDDLTPFSFDGVATSPHGPPSKKSGSPASSKPHLVSYRVRAGSEPAPLRRRGRADGFLRYKWRDTDPDHPDNRALRRAMVGNLPLIWFQGVLRPSTAPSTRCTWPKRSLRLSSSSCHSTSKHFDFATTRPSTILTSSGRMRSGS